MSEAQPAKKRGGTPTVAVTCSYLIQLKKVSFVCTPVTLSVGLALHQCALIAIKLVYVV